jgi:FixJ family two-component response regulator
VAPGQRERRIVAAPGMSTTPLIHVVDDDLSMRTALLLLLGEVGFEARGYASTGEFLLQPQPDRPGCLLLDLRLPGPSGLELQQALLQNKIMLPIVFLTGHGDVDSSVRAMKAGAVDFLTKPVKREILLDAVGRALARNATQRAAQEETDQLQVRFALLTERQREVFDRIVAGKLNKQIADELGIAERTVKREREQVMAKLDANSAADLGRLAELLRRSTPK